LVEDDTHDKLTKAYMAYFKANEKFEARNSVRTHKESRRWLREIRILAKERMEEIHTKHKTRTRRKDTQA
jgi:hypothetical protein|tara:strand:+ start:437 stop:646 length:210 start_codon:yes stop_codon:yes gene_type:complete